MDKIRYSRDTKLSIGVVLLGVAVCTVTDVSVNAKGFIAAFIAVWSTALQQYVSTKLMKSVLIHSILFSKQLRMLSAYFVQTPTCFDWPKF